MMDREGRLDGATVVLSACEGMIPVILVRYLRSDKQLQNSNPMTICDPQKATMDEDLKVTAFTASEVVAATVSATALSALP